MSEKLKSRNSSIDLLKLYFSIIIALYHFGILFMPELIPLGYIAVEGFFMITGYFMMHSVNKAENNDLGKDTLHFITHKFSSFFLPLLFSSLIAFATLIAYRNYTLYDIVFRTMYLLSEIFPLQITGLRSFAPTRVAWYLSSMMVSLLILYPIARKTKKAFTRIICPLAVFLIYGALCYEYKHIDTIMDLFYNTPVRTGLLRGIAGICTGCIIYECVKATQHHKPSTFGRLCFTVIEIGCFATITLYMKFFPSNMENDYFILPVFFILIYSLFGRKSFLSQKISFDFPKHLGTASLLIYLNHYYWDYFIESKLSDCSVTTKFIFYVVVITCSCIIVHTATLITKKLWKNTKPFLKKHFVGE